MPRASSNILPGFYAGFASLVLFALIAAILLGAERAAQGMLAVGALGSGAFGFFSATRGLAAPVAGALRFVRPWLWFTVWTAAGLYDGRYQPMVAAAALAVAMAVCHLFGGWLGGLRRRS